MLVSHVHRVTKKQRMSVLVSGINRTGQAFHRHPVLIVKELKSPDIRGVVMHHALMRINLTANPLLRAFVQRRWNYRYTENVARVIKLKREWSSKSFVHKRFHGLFQEKKTEAH